MLADIQNAVEATRLGAFDFIEKPVSHGELLASVKRTARLFSWMPRPGDSCFGLYTSNNIAPFNKPPVAAAAIALMAGVALVRSGVPLRGRLIVTEVADEETSGGGARHLIAEADLRPNGVIVGEQTLARLAQVPTEEIRKIIKKQEEVGLQLATDGEFLYVVNFNLHGDPVPSSVSAWRR